MDGSKINQKIVMDAEFVLNDVMNEDLVQSGVMKIREELRDECQN